MARPQIEDGHTKIANELVDALARTYFSPAESKVFWAILRKTYGWGKKMDAISYSQLEKATGLDRRHIGPVLKRLKSRNIIVCSNAGERVISEYGVQKDYEQWLLTPIQVTGDTDLSNKSDTDLSNKLALKQVTEGANHLTPITVSSDTDLGHSDTDLSNKSDTDLSNHKSKKHITKETTQKKELAHARAYGEFENVLLSDDDYEKLMVKLGKPHADDLIEQLSAYMKQNPANEKKYKNHYATILNWSRRDGRKDDGKTGRNPRAIPKPGEYTRPEDL